MIDHEVPSQSGIDEIVASIGTLFNNCSLKSFGRIKQSISGTNRMRQKTPWFDKTCTEMRNKYHITRKAYNKHKTQFYKKLLKNTSKQYKSALRKAFKNYNVKKIDALRQLKNSDPKKFWKVLNHNDDNSIPEPQVSLDEFHKFFKTLNEHGHNDNESDIVFNQNEVNGDLNEEINTEITEQEIITAVKSLKNNKAPGTDDIINEQIKSTITIMLPTYVKLFNIVFNTGIIPESWTDGIIKPIYKNKGNPKHPENYRPISLLSCLGKLFTLILNTRLNKYADKTNLIHETQAGFRKQHSTTDNIFILKSLIDLVHTSKKKLYCCFVDFKQAFDAVWRGGLWHKLLKSKINGKCFQVIYNMYKNVKSKIRTSEGISQPFECFAGVRQGENLSPFLFSIFLNDLESFLRDNNVNGIIAESSYDEIINYLKLFILLYADDTVIFSDNEKDFQHALDVFEIYCDHWKLKINISKTKVMVIAKGNSRISTRFNIGNNILEYVNCYKYLGIFFNNIGSFVKTKSFIAEQATKAMFALLKRIKRLSLPYDLQIELFEKTIKPILLYGCEIWGYGNLNALERVQLTFLKYIFQLKKSTPTNIIYGELGIFPLTIDIKTRAISYWAKIVENIYNDHATKISSKVYMLN